MEEVLQTLLEYGTSKAPIGCCPSVTTGGSHDSGSGEKLSFLSLADGDSEGLRLLSGTRDSNEVTLSNKDMFNIYCCWGSVSKAAAELGDWCRR